MTDSALLEPLPSAVPAASPRPLSLRDIRRPIDGELHHFKAYFREAMRSNVKLLDRIIQYTLRVKGKRIRPTIVLLSAKACGSITDATYRGAALVELLHTATLIHDDVVDDAERRRGALSINALWKNKVGVLFGDFLLSRGLLLALDYKEYQLLHVMSDAVRRMSEGELLQIEKTRKLDIDEATYFRIISDKTASLIAACTVSGAISATDNDEVIDNMRTFGEKIGLAFQIRDDLFDYGYRDVGKPLGIDLKERKLTLPLIYALRNATASDRRTVMRIIRKKKKDRADVRFISEFVHGAGGLDYARRKMKSLADGARTSLDVLPPSDAKTSLVALIDYIVTRRQ